MKEDATANDGDGHSEQDRAEREQDPDDVCSLERRAQPTNGGAANGEPQGQSTNDQTQPDAQQIAKDVRRRCRTSDRAFTVWATLEMRQSQSNQSVRRVRALGKRETAQLAPADDGADNTHTILFFANHFAFP